MTKSPFTSIISNTPNPTLADFQQAYVEISERVKMHPKERKTLLRVENRLLVLGWQLYGPKNYDAIFNLVR